MKYKNKIVYILTFVDCILKALAQFQIMTPSRLTHTHTRVTGKSALNVRVGGKKSLPACLPVRPGVFFQPLTSSLPSLHWRFMISQTRDDYKASRTGKKHTTVLYLHKVTYYKHCLLFSVPTNQDIRLTRILVLKHGIMGADGPQVVIMSLHLDQLKKAFCKLFHFVMEHSFTLRLPRPTSFPRMVESRVELQEERDRGRVETRKAAWPGKLQLHVPYS